MNGPAENLIRLHIGGKERVDGWRILDIQPGPNVDFVGPCTELSTFADSSVTAIYSSHVLEHLPHAEILATLEEWRRVLVKGGEIFISVPDLQIISQLLVHPSVPLSLKNDLVKMTFGGQVDAYDFHKTGFTQEILQDFLEKAGFENLQRVPEFGMFRDHSSTRVAGNLISLNMKGTK